MAQTSTKLYAHLELIKPYNTDDPVGWITNTTALMVGQVPASTVEGSAPLIALAKIFLAEKIPRAITERIGADSLQSWEQVLEALKSDLNSLPNRLDAAINLQNLFDNPPEDRRYVEWCTKIAISYRRVHDVKFDSAKIVQLLQCN